MLEIGHFSPLMLHALLLLSVTAATAAVPTLEVRGSEIWLVREGQERQLTRDGKPKGSAVLSPSQRQVAYVDGSTGIVVIDAEGRRIRSFHPAAEINSPSPCNAIVDLQWRSEKVLAAECHVNPSVSEYVETEVETGRTVRDLWGYDFVPAPDGKAVAHVAAYPHFAAPFAQTNSLQLDETTVYPLPQGTRPVAQKGMGLAPDVVKVRGRTYSGIHEFVHRPVWSPDSKRVALVDCTYDWTAATASAQSAAEGSESNRKCSLAVVARDGKFQVFPIAGGGRSALPKSAISWRGSNRVVLRADGISKLFTVP
jgi:hypothetical protein